MSALLAVLNGSRPPPWKRMVDDVAAVGSRTVAEWHDERANVSLAIAELPGGGRAPNVVRAEECALVYDGMGDPLDVITGYRRWGEGCVAALEGEFAFVLWDASERVLVAATDRVGRRTLAYYAEGDTVLVSSRALALLRHPDVPKKWDEVYVAHAIGDWSAQAPGSTPFARVRRLRPGHMLAARSGRVAISSVRRLSSRPADAGASPRALHEEFWSILGRAAQRRALDAPGEDGGARGAAPGAAPGAARCGVSLSGGLDSTSVAVALLEAKVGEANVGVDAFSIVADASPSPSSIDEGPRIRAFLEKYPAVRWRGVDCRDAWGLGDREERLPLADDPEAVAVAFVPSRIRLLEAAQREGVHLVFDGEGGDELFGVAPTLADLLRAGAWLEVARKVGGAKGGRGRAWRQLVVPRLPPALRARWYAREARRVDPMPRWVTRAFTERDATKQALEEAFATAYTPDFPLRVQAVIEGGGYVAAQETQRHTARAHGIELASPLLDAEMIEFAMGLPPRAKESADYDKPFLREAAAGRLPDVVRWAPKEGALYVAQLHAGLARSERALELARRVSASPIAELVDGARLARAIEGARAGAAGAPIEERDAAAAYEALRFVEWSERVRREYGMP